MPPAQADLEPVAKNRRESDSGAAAGKTAGQNGQVRFDPTPPPDAPPPPQQQPKPSRAGESDVLPHSNDDEGFVGRHSHMKYELRDTPGLGDFNRRAASKSSPC